MLGWRQNCLSNRLRTFQLSPRKWAQRGKGERGEGGTPRSSVGLIGTLHVVTVHSSFRRSETTAWNKNTFTGEKNSLYQQRFTIKYYNSYCSYSQPFRTRLKLCKLVLSRQLSNPESEQSNIYWLLLVDQHFNSGTRTPLHVTFKKLYNIVKMRSLL